LPVTGGDFHRSYDGIDSTDRNYPATVSDFYLDKYEITVGRFRQFVNAGKGTHASPPPEGAGVHPKIPGSGWDPSWNGSLSADTPALKENLKCSASYQTWTDSPGANESKPINCLDWHTAFAFCAWDGGRLPSEAEWNYAASGGDEQRYYPWSSSSTPTVIDDSYAVYRCSGACIPLPVGSKSTKGDGKWGQSDLAGNLSEWVLDWYGSYAVPCDNCANLATTSYPVSRGGYFSVSSWYIRSSDRGGQEPLGRNYDIGARCARSAM
jgi:formylglycine-generating enzyme required for sulfatase activity